MLSGPGERCSRCLTKSRVRSQARVQSSGFKMLTVVTTEAKAEGRIG